MVLVGALVVGLLGATVMVGTAAGDSGASDEERGFMGQMSTFMGDYVPGDHHDGDHANHHDGDHANHHEEYEEHHEKHHEESNRC